MIFFCQVSTVSLVTYGDIELKTYSHASTLKSRFKILKTKNNSYDPDN